MSDLFIKIGDRIRFLRKEKLLTQEQLSEITGIHSNYIGVIERGERNITLDIRRQSNKFKHLALR
jgi:transcriptional regulator with XRE-family HTH domain